MVRYIQVVIVIFIFGTNNTTRMTILNGGYVGIGTTNPETKLTIKTGTNYDGLILTNSTDKLLISIKY